MLKFKHFMLIILVLSLLFSCCFSLSLTSAAYTAPKFLAQYVPAGFVIDEKQSKSQSVGMFNTTGIAARKVNQLPKPFVTPEFSELAIGYMEPTNPAYLQPMWEEIQRDAEQESKTQTSPHIAFLEKELIGSGGVIYWYKGMNVFAQGSKDEASQVIFYGAKFIKRMDKGVLKITITDFVGERDVIRKCFK